MLLRTLHNKWRLYCIGDSEIQKSWIVMLPPVSHNWFLYKIRNSEVTYNQLAQETLTLPLIPSCSSEEQKTHERRFDHHKGSYWQDNSTEGHVLGTSLSLGPWGSEGGPLWSRLQGAAFPSRCRSYWVLLSGLSRSFIMLVQRINC